MRTLVITSFLAAAVATQAADWPDIGYTQVRAYHLDGRPLVEDGRLHATVEDKKGVLLTPSQLNRLLTAVFHRTPKHCPLINCYEPHHGFVFFDGLKRPVAVVEICFTCLHVRFSPEEPKSVHYTDFPGLAQLCEELGLPGDQTVADLKTRLDKSEKRWRERLASEPEEARRIFDILYSRWNNECAQPQIAILSDARVYIGQPSYRAIVDLGRPALPYLKEKMEEDEGLSFMLGSAVVEIEGWNDAEFSANSVQEFRAKVLAKMRAQPSSR